MSDIVAELENLRPYQSPEVAVLLKGRTNPNFWQGVENEAYFLGKRLRASPTDELLVLAREVIALEKAHRKTLVVLAERAEALIQGRTFDDDPTERGSGAWAAKIVRNRHASDVWQRSAAKIVAILEAQ